MTGQRFLILSAGMGSGHDAVARELAARLKTAGHQAVRADVLDLFPAGIGGGLRAAYHAVIAKLPVMYAGIYRAFFRTGAAPRPGSAPLAALGEGRLLELARRQRADVVVSVFHLAAQITGRLRARGALPVPTAVLMTDFEAHRQWLHPGNDLYLCHTEEIAAGIRQRTGCAAAGNGPLVNTRFTDASSAVPADRAEHWRRCLSPGGRPLVLLSTGAWGIGSSLAQTARLLDRAGYAPVVLCGENERLRRRLSAQPRIAALSWVDDMPALMAAASALIDNAAGQTAIEALAAGLPVIGYRPIPGHGAANVRLMARLGLSDYASGRAELLRSLRLLTAPGAARDRRIEAGRALFHTGPVTPLVDLGSGEPAGDGKTPVGGVQWASRQVTRGRLPRSRASSPGPVPRSRRCSPSSPPARPGLRDPSGSRCVPRRGLPHRGGSESSPSRPPWWSSLPSVSRSPPSPVPSSKDGDVPAGSYSARMKPCESNKLPASCHSAAHGRRPCGGRARSWAERARHPRKAGV